MRGYNALPHDLIKMMTEVCERLNPTCPHTSMAAVAATMPRVGVKTVYGPGFVTVTVPGQGIGMGAYS